MQPFGFPKLSLKGDQWRHSVIPPTPAITCRREPTPDASPPGNPDSRIFRPGVEVYFDSILRLPQDFVRIFR